MSIADRLREKALAAKAVTTDAVKDLEAGLDAIIAEKDVVAKKKQDAMAAHNDALGAVKGEWDGIKASVDILSNNPPPVPEQ